MSARLGIRGPLRPALYLLAATSLLLAGVELPLLLAVPGAPVVGTLLFTGAGVVYIGTGLIALARRPSNRLGVVMVAGGLSLFVADLGATADRVLVAAGTVVRRWCSRSWSTWCWPSHRDGWTRCRESS